MGFVGAEDAVFAVGVGSQSDAGLGSSLRIWEIKTRTSACYSKERNLAAKEWYTYPSDEGEIQRRRLCPVDSNHLSRTATFVDLKPELTN